MKLFRSSVTLVLSTIIAFTLSGCTITAGSIESGSTTISSVVTDSQLAEVVAVHCEELAKAYESKAPQITNKDTSILRGRVKTLKKVDNLDARSASKYQAKNTWVSMWSPKVIEPETVAASDALKIELVALAVSSDKVDEKLASLLISKGEIELQLVIKNTCDIKPKTYSTYVSLSDQFETLQDSVTTLAASAPWYPDGYSAYSGDSDIAYKWVKGYSCNYMARCSHAKVISRYGCPTSLYVEVNFEDNSGSVVDWSNDTASGLGAGQSAVLEFTSYSDYADSTRLTEISCY